MVIKLKFPNRIKKVLQKVYLWMQLFQDRLLGCDFATPMDNQQTGITPPRGYGIKQPPHVFSES